MPVTINGSAGVTTNSGAVYDSLQRATVQNSTSGTAIDFTGIPSWAKRITVIVNGVSISGTSNIQIQLGTSLGFTTSGYAGVCANQSGATVTTNASGFIINVAVSAVDTMTGQAIINNMTGNTWVYSSTVALTNTNGARYGAGHLALSGTLDRVRVTTFNGTDTFDAGSINIMYE